MLTDRMGIDIWEVVDAASSKPYGFMRFEPGPGMGGHCLPVDPFYLCWRAREFDMTTEFIELAGKVNQQMPYHCVAKVERVLNDAGLPVKGARIAVLGVSYKPGVGDIRESPSLKIIALLRALGAESRYHDPHVPRCPSSASSSRPLERGARRRRPHADRHRAPERRPRGDRRAARLVVDLRGVTRGTPSADERRTPDERWLSAVLSRSARARADARRGRGDRRGRRVRRLRGRARRHRDRRRLRDRGPRCARQAPAAGRGLRRAGEVSRAGAGAE